MTSGMTWIVRASAVSLVLAVALLASSAVAGGRAACSAQFGFDQRLRCFVEQTVFTAGPFEVGAGAYWEPLRSAIPFPYTMLGWFQPSWWIVAELGKPLHHPGWMFALSAGFRW